MAANLLKIGIPPTAAGGFSGAGQRKIRAKRINFFTRINALDPWDQMPSQMLFIDASVDMFAGENQLATA